MADGHDVACPGPPALQKYKQMSPVLAGSCTVQIRNSLASHSIKGKFDEDSNYVRLYREPVIIVGLR